MLKRYLVLLLTVCCTAFCLCGCGYEENENIVLENELPQAKTEITPDIPEPENPEKEVTEEEKIESVYLEGKEKTFCIFTSNGGNGTGFLYKDKYVITNAHVLYDADDFTLKDAKEQEYKGTVIFNDFETDIVIIQIDNYQGESVKFGDSDSIVVGESVILIGNPLDGEPFSYCTGKRVELEDPFCEQVNSREWYIPVDANIVSGYSGGPVFNLSGELVGISNASYIGDLSAYEFDYLSFIIPINKIKELIESYCV